MREVVLDPIEGADIVMVKPAMSYLDIVRTPPPRSPLCRSPPTRCPASTR